MLYVQIHQLYERKFRKSKIAKELKVSRPTIYKYLQMTFEEAKKLLEGPHRKPRKLAPYRDWIIAWLEEYPHLSAAQIRDWLLERYPDMVIGESTVRTYVKEMREIYQIKKKVMVRQYETIPEQPMGKQIQ